MRLEELIAAIDASIDDPRKRLPQPVFDLVSRITPVVNVDLLVRNERREVLLTWRHDELYHGWHVPGGVVREQDQPEPVTTHKKKKTYCWSSPRSASR